MSPAVAAERLVIGYGAIARSVPVSSLTTYVRQGWVSPALAPYLQQLGARDRATLRRVLQSGFDPGIVSVDGFLHSTLGSDLLTQIGRVVRIDQDQDGAQAIRAALVIAAGKPGGITPLNFLQAFPTTTVYVDGALLSAALGQFEQLKVQAEQALKLEDSAPPLPLPTATVPLNPASRGPYPFRRRALSTNHPERPADFYLSAAPGTRPIIVISHGWGESRDTYAYLAERWASQGFHVLVLVHPGSDRQWLLDLYAGRTEEVISPEDFRDRPQTVDAFLRRLAELARTDWQFAGRLDLKRVGVFGHSLGADTALAVAGAPLDLPYLNRICVSTPPDPYAIDLAYFVQCRARRLGNDEASFRLPQVKAVIASSPTASVLFGEVGLAQIAVPTMVVTATDDSVAPAAIEQIAPFQHLPEPRYLLALVGGTHFSVQGAGAPSLLPVKTPSSEGARETLAAFSTAFWQVYLEGDRRYAAYLIPMTVQLDTAHLPVALLGR